MIEDLFENMESVKAIQEALNHSSLVDITMHPIQAYWPSNDYTIKRLRFHKKFGVENQIAFQAAEICKRFGEKFGEMWFEKSMCYAVIEALKNAYHHSNNYNVEKPIILAHKVEGMTADAIAIGSGTKFNPIMMDFVLEQRKDKKKLLNFYEVCGDIMNRINYGLGISTMYRFCDEVRFFKAANNSLGVQLTKKLSI